MYVRKHASITLLHTFILSQSHVISAYFDEKTDTHHWKMYKIHYNIHRWGVHMRKPEAFTP